MTGVFEVLGGGYAQLLGLISLFFEGLLSKLLGALRSRQRVNSSSHLQFECHL